MSVECLRCGAKLEEYLFASVNILPQDAGHVTLECPRCGHLEFLSRTSPLLEHLQATPTYAGDGD